MKIAVLHEMLIKYGGAEKVVEKLLKIFPEADLYTLIYDEKKIGKFFPKNRIYGIPKITQRIYNLTGNQRFCLPFMARGVEELDFSKYDVVLGSSSGFAHGAITKPETKFIVYYHSPARYMWDWTNEYKKDIGWDKGIKGYILNKLFLKLRQWDYVASKRVDIVLANSTNTKNRLRKYHRNEAIVVYPNVETSRFDIIDIPEKKDLETQDDKNNIIKLKFGEYFIIISALTEFKKIEVAISAFNDQKLKDKKLLIVGGGDYKDTLEKISKNGQDNIYFAGPKYGDELKDLLQKSRGYIFPGEEDFGITPIEAMACGKGVFAYRGGGLLETVIEGKTGEFFDDKNGKDFIEKFISFDKKIENNDYNPQEIRKNALRFSEEEFEKKITELVYNK